MQQFQKKIHQRINGFKNLYTLRRCVCVQIPGGKQADNSKMSPNKTADQNETMLQLYIWSKKQFVKKRAVNLINRCTYKHTFSTAILAGAIYIA